MMHTTLSNSHSEFSIRSYQTDKEITFQMLFNNLEEFLNELTKDKNDNIPNQEDMTAQQDGGEDLMTKAKAKEYFINSAHDIIFVMRQQLEADGMFYYLPMSHLDKLISNTKQELKKSYHEISESIKNKKQSSPESSSVDSKQDGENNESTTLIKKKGKKGKNKIPKKALLILKNWLTEHFNDPYPSCQEKLKLSRETGMTLKQVQIWFINARGRIWRKSCNQDNFSSLIAEKLKENDPKVMGDQAYKPKPF